MFSFLLLMIALNVAKHPIFNLVDNNISVIVASTMLSCGWNYLFDIFKLRIFKLL